MNREIKFRQPIFNRKGEFESWHYWGFLSEGNFTSPAPPIKEALKNSQEYTGLHDKNGREIYEGDIVELEGTRGARGWIRYEEQRTAYVVEFGNIESGGDYQDLNHFIVKVIDNIHENSELLEKSKEVEGTI